MEESNQKRQEMQFLEQNLQNLLMQKQAFQLEISETESALKELGNSDDEVYKIVGQLMIKSDKKKMVEDLLNRKKLLTLRLNSFERQGKTMTEQYTKLRDDVVKSKKNSKN